MPETTPLIKAALNLRVGVGFDVYEYPYNRLQSLHTITYSLIITPPTNRAKLEPFDKTNAGNPHKYRLSAF